MKTTIDPFFRLRTLCKRPLFWLLCGLGLTLAFWPRTQTEKGVVHTPPPRRDKIFFSLTAQDAPLTLWEQQQLPSYWQPTQPQTFYAYTASQPDWQQDLALFADEDTQQKLAAWLTQQTGAEGMQFCGGFWAQPQLAVLLLQPTFSSPRHTVKDANVRTVSLWNGKSIQLLDDKYDFRPRDFQLLQYPDLYHLRLPDGNVYGWQDEQWQLLGQRVPAADDSGVFLCATPQSSYTTAVFDPALGRYCGVYSHEIPFAVAWRVLEDDPQLLQHTKILAWLAETQAPGETVHDCLQRTVVSCSVAGGQVLRLRLADATAEAALRQTLTYQLQLNRAADGSWQITAAGGAPSHSFDGWKEEHVLLDVDIAAQTGNPSVFAGAETASLQQLAQSADGQLTARYSLATQAPALLVETGTTTLQLDGPAGWVPGADKAAFLTVHGRTLLAMGMPESYDPFVERGAKGPFASETLYLVDAEGGKAQAFTPTEALAQLTDRMRFHDNTIKLGDQRVSWPEDIFLFLEGVTPFVQYSCTPAGVQAHVSVLLQKSGEQWLLRDLLTATVTLGANADDPHPCFVQPQLHTPTMALLRKEQRRVVLPTPTAPPVTWPLQLSAQKTLTPLSPTERRAVGLETTERLFYRFTAQQPTWIKDAAAFGDDEALQAAMQEVRRNEDAPDLQFVRGFWYDFDGDGRREALVQLYGIFTDEMKVPFYGDSHMVYINAEGQAQYLYAANAENIECRLLQYPGFCHIYLTGGNQTAAGGGLAIIYIAKQGELEAVYADYHTSLDTGVFIEAIGPHSIGPRYSFFSPELGQYCDTGYVEISPEQAWALLENSPALTDADEWLAEWLQEYRQPGESAFDCLRRLPCRYRLGAGKYLQIREDIDEDGRYCMFATLYQREDGLFVGSSRGMIGDYRTFWSHNENITILHDVTIDDALARATTKQVEIPDAGPWRLTAEIGHQEDWTLYDAFYGEERRHLLQKGDAVYWMPGDRWGTAPEMTCQTSAAAGGLQVLRWEYTAPDPASDLASAHPCEQLVVLSQQQDEVVGWQFPVQQLSEAVLQQLSLRQWGRETLLALGDQIDLYYLKPIAAYYDDIHLHVRFVVNEQEILLKCSLFLGEDPLNLTPKRSNSFYDFAIAHLTFADGVFTVSDFELHS